MAKNWFKYPIVCAVCDKARVYTIRNKRIAISDARKKGWTSGKYTKCPNCKDTPNWRIEQKSLGLL